MKQAQREDLHHVHPQPSAMDDGVRARCASQSTVANSSKVFGIFPSNLTHARPRASSVLPKTLPSSLTFQHILPSFEKNSPPACYVPHRTGRFEGFASLVQRFQSPEFEHSAKSMGFGKGLPPRMMRSVACSASPLTRDHSIAASAHNDAGLISNGHRPQKS